MAGFWTPWHASRNYMPLIMLYVYVVQRWINMQHHYVHDNLHVFVTTCLDYHIIINKINHNRKNLMKISWSLQTERSEHYGGDGFVRKRRAAGRVDQKGKHTRRRDGETQNGRRQVLHTVQQQRSDRRSAKSPNSGTGVGVQDRQRQVYLSIVQSKYFTTAPL